MKTNLLIFIFLFISITTFAQKRRTIAEAETIIHQLHGQNTPCLTLTKEINQDGSTTLSFYEKHTPDCWGGQGDPDTSPRYATYTIDNQGIIWQEDFAQMLSFPIGNYTKPVKAIKNPDTWQHPIKKVFERYNVNLIELSLYADETYPIFSVEMPDNLMKNEKLFAQFKIDVIKANFEWDCSLWQDGLQIKLQGKKRQ